MIYILKLLNRVMAKFDLLGFKSVIFHGTGLIGRREYFNVESNRVSESN